MQLTHPVVLSEHLLSLITTILNCIIHVLISLLFRIFIQVATLRGDLTFTDKFERTNIFSKYKLSHCLLFRTVAIIAIILRDIAFINKVNTNLVKITASVYFIAYAYPSSLSALIFLLIPNAATRKTKSGVFRLDTGSFYTIDSKTDFTHCIGVKCQDYIRIATEKNKSFSFFF